MKFSPTIVILFQASLSSFSLGLLSQLCPGSRPPSLLVTVAGNVTYGKNSEHPVTAPGRSVDGQPRVFFQTFMLVPDPAAPVAGVGEVAKYYVDADSMRFVG